MGTRNRDRMIPFNPTLGDVLRLDGSVHGFCDGCIRVKVLPLQKLIDRFGANTLLADLAKRLVCKMCGEKNVRLEARYPR